jgi:methionine-rich copper-binding protein CopC
MRKLLLPLLPVTLLALASVAEGQGATGLAVVSSSPANGAVVAPLTSITMTFNEPIDLDGAGVRLTDTAAALNAPSLTTYLMSSGLTGVGTTVTIALPSGVPFTAGMVIRADWGAYPHSEAGSGPRGHGRPIQGGSFSFTIGQPARLVFSTPAANASLSAAPTSVALVFDQAIDLTKSSLSVDVKTPMEVVDHKQIGGTTVHVSTSLAGSADGKHMTATLAGPARLGTFTVTWSAQAKAGMPQSGTYTFKAL